MDNLSLLNLHCYVPNKTINAKAETNIMQKLLKGESRALARARVRLVFQKAVSFQIQKVCEQKFSRIRPKPKTAANTKITMQR